MVNLIQRNEDQLQQQLEMFWKTDYGNSPVNDKKSMSIEYSQELKIMETTAIKVEGHHQIAVLLIFRIIVQWQQHVCIC